MLQTTQLISDVCFMTDHVAYASSLLSEGADRVGGQLRGDSVPLQWRIRVPGEIKRSSEILEEGGGRLDPQLSPEEIMSREVELG